MLESLRSHPLIFSNSQLSAASPESEDVELSVTMKLRVNVSEEGEPTLATAALRIGSVKVWSPDEPVYFEGSEIASSSVSLVSSAMNLSFSLLGSFKSPALGGYEDLGPDFRAVKSLPVVAAVNINFEDQPGVLGPLEVGGTVVVSRRLGEGAISGGAVVVRGAITGKAQMFAAPLPAKDKSGQVRGTEVVFIQVFFIKEPMGTPVVSRDVQIKAAKKFWLNCGIDVEDVGDDVEIPIDSSAVKLLMNTHDLSPIFRLVATHSQGGKGVPVIFLKRGVSGGGGCTLGSGVSSAMVALNDQDCGNDTLLAHELGHVFGGKEVNSGTFSEGYWSDSSGTIMEGGNTLCQKAAAVLGTKTCENASKYMYYRPVPVGVHIFFAAIRKFFRDIFV